MGRAEGRRTGRFRTTPRTDTDVILLTRLNGPAFAVNPDLIERAESTPDTVVTLVDGAKFVVAEPVSELIVRIRDFRASVIATAHALEVGAPAPTYEVVPAPLRDREGPAGRPARAAAAGGGTSPTVVPLHRREP